MDVAPLSKRIVITGGRSRLAGVIRKHLTARGAQLVTLSRSEGDSHLSLEDLFVNNLVDNADTLLHLAWSTVPLSSERHVGLEWKQDIPLLLRILETISASPNRERLHFVFFSSGGAVYGNARDGRPSVETDTCEPIGWYGQAKLAAERLIQEYGRRHGISYTILRISNPYGFAVPAHKPQGIIPFILKSAREGTPLSIWGDGTARKDFLHYTDFIAALEGVIRQRLVGIFNVSCGRSHSVREVVELVERAVGKRVQTQHVPGHSWDVHDSLLDNTKLRRMLAWSPQVDLREGLSRTVAESQRS
jgi:UDP-glucose 4-epimerase